jgi:hypothetical protein
VEAFADIIHGKFTLDEFPTAENVKSVALSLIHYSDTLYRSDEFSLARAQRGGLDIYLFQPGQRDLNQSDPVNVTAGTISQALAAAASSLPGNTTLTANPWGLSFAGTQQGATIQFGVSLVPWTTIPIKVFLQLALHNYKINVGLPAGCKETAKGLLAQIKAELGKENTAVNLFIRSQLVELIKQQGLDAANTNKLIDKLVSITFKSIVFPNSHIWPLGDTQDMTTVMTLNPVVGFPQDWS